MNIQMFILPQKDRDDFICLLEQTLAIEKGYTEEPIGKDWSNEELW